MASSNLPPDGVIPDGGLAPGARWNTEIELDTTKYKVGNASIHIIDDGNNDAPTYMVSGCGDGLGNNTTPNPELVPCAPGDPVLAEGWVYADTNSAGYNVSIGVDWFNSVGTLLSTSWAFDAHVTAANTWEFKSGVVEAPASTAQRGIRFGRTTDGLFFDSWFSGVGMAAFPKAFRAYRSSTQAIAYNTQTVVQFNTEDFDYGGVYDNSTYKFTAPATGLYSISSVVSFSSSFADQKGAALTMRKGGSTILCQTSMEASGASETVNLHQSTVVLLTAGEYVEMVIYHGDSAGSKNLMGYAYATWFSAAALST